MYLDNKEVPRPGIILETPKDSSKNSVQHQRARVLWTALLLNSTERSTWPWNTTGEINESKA